MAVKPPSHQLAFAGVGAVRRAVALLVGEAAVARRRVRLIGLAVTVGVDDPIIVLGMLVIVLGRDAVARRVRVARQREIFLEHLIGVAAHPDIGTVAVERLMAQRHLAIAPAATLAATMATAAMTARHSAIALAVAATPRPLHMGTLS